MHIKAWPKPFWLALGATVGNNSEIAELFPSNSRPATAQAPKSPKVARRLPGLDTGNPHSKGTNQPSLFGQCESLEQRGKRLARAGPVAAGPRRVPVGTDQNRSLGPNSSGPVSKGVAGGQVGDCPPATRRRLTPRRVPRRRHSRGGPCPPHGDDCEGGAAAGAAAAPGPVGSARTRSGAHKHEAPASHQAGRLELHWQVAKAHQVAIWPQQRARGWSGAGPVTRPTAASCGATQLAARRVWRPGRSLGGAALRGQCKAHVGCPGTNDGAAAPAAAAAAAGVAAAAAAAALTVPGPVGRLAVKRRVGEGEFVAREDERKPASLQEGKRRRKGGEGALTGLGSAASSLSLLVSEWPPELPPEPPTRAGCDVTLARRRRRAATRT